MSSIESSPISSCFTILLLQTCIRDLVAIYFAMSLFLCDSSFYVWLTIEPLISSSERIEVTKRWIKLVFVYFSKSSKFIIFKSKSIRSIENFYSIILVILRDFLVKQNILCAWVRSIHIRVIRLYALQQGLVYLLDNVFVGSIFPNETGMTCEVSYSCIHGIWASMIRLSIDWRAWSCIESTLNDFGCLLCDPCWAGVRFV